MGIKCGIVGLPNVGKSTLFNALTAAEIPAENYPFCTIDPNVGVVTVPDPKLDALAEIVKPEKIVPTVVEFVDIAGLVEGASQGQGLGNQFLAHIRETHAIAHLVRCFVNDDIVHVAGKINPLHDIEIIDTELMLADLETGAEGPPTSGEARRRPTTRRLSRAATRLKKLLDGARERQTRAHRRAARERGRHPERAAPHHGQARHVHRQRRRGLARGQSARRCRAQARGRARRGARRHLGGDRSRARAAARSGARGVPVELGARRSPA